MRLLFVKETLESPRSSGHDVHSYYMMRACVELGHDVSFATVTQPTPRALDGLTLQTLYDLGGPGDSRHLPASWLQRRFRSFYGVPEAQIGRVSDAVRSSRADAVIIVGLDVLPYFVGLSGVMRVWYAADEWVLHHLSQLKFGDSRFRENLRDAAVKGLYERAHRRVVDRVWVVSEADRQAMRWVAGMRCVDVVPNGVDATYFSPGNESIESETCVFWGRLDFGPNVQALQWFCEKVWPLIRLQQPAARFNIIGFNPTPPVSRLGSLPGVTLIPNLPDLRPLVQRQAVVVLPFISGGGIKNKLLEAAAMGRPIVCTPAASRGLRSIADAPLAVVSTAEAMAQSIASYWRNPSLQSSHGAALRRWVVQHHSWITTAREALLTLGSEGGTPTPAP
jgi:glycosyltransferase involved in cell wall biosynthesis